MFPLWNFFLSRRAFAFLAMAALLAGGLYALSVLPKESTPEVIVPVGVVTTVLPNATAADIERLVTDVLEPAIRNTPQIDTVTSTSRAGVSSIVARFSASSDINTSIQDLRNAVEGVRRDLPSDAEAPTVSKIDFQDQPILMVGIGTDLAPETLTRLGQDLKDNIISVQGVSRVEVSGVRARQISVIVHTAALERHNLRVEQVLAAIRSANASSPAGVMTTDGVSYPIQFEGSVEDAETIAAVPIATPSGTVTVGDVATLIDGFEKARNISRIKLNGEESQYALTLSVYTSAGGSIIDVSNRVKQRLAELEDSLLAGSIASITYDAAEDVEDSISELSFSGLQTVALVLLVLLVAIGAREAMVAAFAIPFSFVIAFLGMLLTGNTINFVSLFSLIIAIGILVDSSIVIVEGMYTNRRRGLDRFESARKAVKDFGTPLIAGTLTTVAVFVPLFFLSGVVGQFIKSIPFTIVVVLLASILVALGFIPSIALNVIRKKESAFAKMREEVWQKIGRWYRARMEALFASRTQQRLFGVFLAVSFIGALILPAVGALKVAMFPAADYDLFYVEIELPQATPLAETDRVARSVEEIVADIPYLQSLSTTVGATSPFNAFGAGSGEKFANITVNLHKDRSLTSLAITQALREEIARHDFGAAIISVYDAEGGPPAGAPVVVKIWSHDLDDLGLATEILEGVVKRTPGTRDVSSSLADDGTELSVAIHRALANEYGLTTADIATTLRAALSGLDATKIRAAGDDIDVKVLLDLNQSFTGPDDIAIATADDIRRIPIATARGTVPLGSLVSITADRTSSAIRHEDGVRIATVVSHLADGANAIEVTAAVRSSIEEVSLPDSVTVTFGGEDEEIRQMFTEMMIALIAGLVLMFTILVLEFNTFSKSLRLLSAVPLSLTGVLWGLFITGQPLSFTAFLGIIALSGVIINHGILLIDAMNRRQKEAPELSPKSLVLDVSESRVRPIILTTITTVVGVIPLTIVSAMWAPLAFTIAFGLLYGTILTLVYIPLRSYRAEVKKATQVAR